MKKAHAVNRKSTHFLKYLVKKHRKYESIKQNMNETKLVKNESLTKYIQNSTCKYVTTYKTMNITQEDL